MPQAADNACTLEELIARHGLRRGREQARLDTRATGHAALDAHLPGGGLPRGALTEILPRPAGSGELALLLPLLAQRTAAGERIALIAPPYSPYAPALANAGLSLERVLVVTAGDAAADLWAAEQLLRSPLIGAVLCWRPVTAKALRRLQVAAERGGGVGVLYRGERDAAVSMAALRLAVAPAGGGVEVTVLKCRGPAGARVRCSLERKPATGAEIPSNVAVPAPAPLRA